MLTGGLHQEPKRVQDEDKVSQDLEEDQFPLPRLTVSQVFCSRQDVIGADEAS